MNQGGSILILTPLGTSTADRYVSGLLATFLTTLFAVRFPESDVIVSEGWFRSDGLLKLWPHEPPVAILTADGSEFGREHKKLR